jgi:transposase
MAHISQFDAGKVVALKEQGLSIRKISTLLNIPKSTVFNSLARYSERGTIKRKEGSGRVSLLKDEHKNIISKILDEEPKISVPKINAKLQEKTGVKVSSNTIRKELKEQGFAAYSPLKRPLLSKKNIISRYDICSKWSFEPKELWDEVVFSDECKFNLFNSDGCTKIWRKPGTGLNSEYLTKTVKHDGGGLMAWGCISSRGVGRLVFFGWNYGQICLCKHIG